MTIVETFAFVCAVKVNKKYNNNDIRRLSHCPVCSSRQCNKRPVN